MIDYQMDGMKFKQVCNLFEILADKNWITGEMTGALSFVW